MNERPSPRGADALSRRESLLRLGAFGLGGAGLLAAAKSAGCACAHDARAPASSAGGSVSARPELFSISLAQWSYHRAIQTRAMDPLDFPRVARDEHSITAVEHVSTLQQHGARRDSIAELRRRCDDCGVRSLLIMVDGEGALGDPDDAARARAVDSHRKWLDAAKALGCHSIRVNAESKGGWAEQQRLAADGLHRLCEVADPYDLDILLENHWGLSSNGAWVVGLVSRVGHARFGTLPDFGNFDPKEYDKYDGVRDMMPFARAVSAKSHDFDDVTREETKTDYRRMLRTVLNAGYHGHVGIEYEGERLPEAEGVRRTRDLLARIRDEFTTGGRT